MSGLKLLSSLLAGTIAAGSVGGLALARENETSAMKALGAAQVSLGQAILAAEKASGARAIDAGLDDEHGVGQYEVTVVNKGKHHTLFVDSQTGKILKTVAATDDEHDED
jgi:uncharacterized membrane protein YkoI